MVGIGNKSAKSVLLLFTALAEKVELEKPLLETASSRRLSVSVNNGFSV